MANALESLGRSGAIVDIPALVEFSQQIKKFEQEKKQRDFELKKSKAEEAFLNSPADLSVLPGVLEMPEFEKQIRDGLGLEEGETPTNRQVKFFKEEILPFSIAQQKFVIDKRIGAARKDLADANKIFFDLKRTLLPDDPKLIKAEALVKFKAEQVRNLTTEGAGAIKATEERIRQREEAQRLGVSDQGIRETPIGATFQEKVNLPENVANRDLLRNALKTGNRKEIDRLTKLISQGPSGGEVKVPTPSAEKFTLKSLDKFKVSGKFSDLKRRDEEAERPSLINAKRDDAVRILDRQFGTQTVTGGFIIDEEKFSQFQQATVFLDDFIGKNSAQTAAILAATKAKIGADVFNNVLALIQKFRAEKNSGKEIKRVLESQATQLGFEVKDVEFLMRVK